jgi:hypothetical protein
MTGVVTATIAILITQKAPAQSQATALTPPAEPSAESQIKAKALQNYKFQDTSGITDLRMKAEQGSLSRYSGKMSLVYLGPVVDDLSNPYQPDPDSSLTHNLTSLRGDMSLRYRNSPESTVSLGTVVSRVTPFTEDARTDISTPFVSFDHAHRMRAYQVREAVEAALITNPEMKNVVQVASLSATFSIMRNINYSRWEAGLDSRLAFGVYNRQYDPGPPQTARTENRVRTRLFSLFSLSLAAQTVRCRS